MRDWWLRVLLVLQRPRAVFVALRDTDPDSLADRSEPVLAIVILAGMATVLSTATAGRLLDDGTYDGLLIAVWTFVAGGIYGAIAYFVIGGLLDRERQGARLAGHLPPLASHRCLRRSADRPVARDLAGEARPLR